MVVCADREQKKKRSPGQRSIHRIFGCENGEWGGGGKSSEHGLSALTVGSVVYFFLFMELN